MGGLSNKDTVRSAMGRPTLSYTGCFATKGRSKVRDSSPYMHALPIHSFVALSSMSMSKASISRKGGCWNHIFMLTLLQLSVHGAQ